MGQEGLKLSFFPLMGQHWAPEVQHSASRGSTAPPLVPQSPHLLKVAGDEPPAHASGPSPPPSSLPFQRHYKSNGLERKASKILKPSSIINADSKFPLRAFYIATVTRTRWWSCCSSPPHPTAPGRMAAVPEAWTQPGRHLGTCQALHQGWGWREPWAGKMVGFLLKGVPGCSC